MLNRRYTEALERQASAAKRLAAAEENLAAAFVRILRRKSTEDPVSDPRPCINVTPPKRPQKK